MVRTSMKGSEELAPSDKAAVTRSQGQPGNGERTLRMRISELKAAERHIAELEAKLLKLNEYRRELRLLKEQKRALQKSPERRIGQVLLAPYRLPERLINVIWNRLFRPNAGEGAVVPSKYHEWLERHRATARELDRMRHEALTFALQPLVTIITPVFNTPVRWLRECVESVLAQTYEKWELILVDDHSIEPEMLRCLSELAASDSRIILAKDEKRRGISAASNRGLALAQGDWVGFLDHDDLLEPDALF